MEFTCHLCIGWHSDSNSLFSCNLLWYGSRLNHQQRNGRAARLEYIYDQYGSASTENMVRLDVEYRSFFAISINGRIFPVPGLLQKGIQTKTTFTTIDGDCYYCSTRPSTSCAVSQNLGLPGDLLYAVCRCRACLAR